MYLGNLFRASLINPWRACARGLLCVCVCVCVFLSAGANPRTGASRRLTKGTSGLSGTFLTIIKGVFSKTASLEC